MRALSVLQEEIISCRRCPRLVAWREDVAQKPPHRYEGEEYWARPVPGFGDAHAQLLMIGLAPGAHGSNRTGRMFTGDKSGEWLFRALHREGFANQAEVISVDDGLQLLNCYITATCRCAPLQNKPTRGEITNCREYLLREWQLLPRVRVVLGLGKIGFDAAFDTARELHYTSLTARPRFGHGVEVELNEKLVLMGTYHPSQQNTFTGKLTEPMLDNIFSRARKMMD